MPGKKKIYILDTSVIIDNPECPDILRNGEENDVYIPYSVLLELDKLKRKSDLKTIISEIGTKLENDKYIKLIKNPEIAYRDDELGDERIMNDIRYFYEGLKKTEQKKTFVVSNDKFFRVRIRHENINVQEFLSSQPIVSESQAYTGFIEDGSELIANSFIWKEGKPFYNNDNPRYIDHENKPWSVQPRNVYQNLAIELMMDPSLDLITLHSRAGYGKTYLSLACAFDLVLNKPKQFSKIYIIKPNIEIGEKLGFLPGEVEEKLKPFFKPIEYLIGKLHDTRPANRLFLDSTNGKMKLDPKKCEILPLNYVRGMNMEDCVVIIDEAQNLTRLHTRTLLTRMGQKVKCFVLGDTDQVDHPYLNRYNNGLNWIVKKFKGLPNYGHIILKGTKSRGPITDMVLNTQL